MIETLSIIKKASFFWSKMTHAKNISYDYFTLLLRLSIYKWITLDHACESAGVQMGGDALIIKRWRIHTWQCWQRSSAARKPSVRQSSLWRQAGYNQAVQRWRDLFFLALSSLQGSFQGSVQRQRLAWIKVRVTLKAA